MRFGFIFYSMSKLIDEELQWTLYAMIAVKHGTKRLTIRYVAESVVKCRLDDSRASRIRCR